MSATVDERLWLRLRQYVDGSETLAVVLAQLLDVAVELEELSAAGYVLERPVETDGLVLSRQHVPMRDSQVPRRAELEPA